MKNRLTKDQATFFLSGLGPCTSAVARAAMDNGVARFPVTDRDQYRLGPDERLSKHIKKIGEMVFLISYSRTLKLRKYFMRFTK